MAYSLYNFRWRAAHIRNQAEERYDDVSGPLALFGIMTVAVLINAIFQISNKLDAIHAADLEYYYNNYY